MFKLKKYTEKVAKVIIDLHGKNIAPWQKNLCQNLLVPVNPYMKKEYEGFNALYLVSKNDRDPRWMTEFQTKLCGGIIKPDAQPVELVYKEGFKLKFINVYNGEDINGIQPFDQIKCGGISYGDNISKNIEKMLTANGYNKLQFETIKSYKYMDKPFYDFIDSYKKYQQGSLKKEPQFSKALSLHKEQLHSYTYNLNKYYHQAISYCSDKIVPYRKFYKQHFDGDKNSFFLHTEMSNFFINMKAGYNFPINFNPSIENILTQKPEELFLACNTGQEVVNKLWGGSMRNSHNQSISRTKSLRKTISNSMGF